MVLTQNTIRLWWVTCCSENSNFKRVNKFLTLIFYKTHLFNKFTPGLFFPPVAYVWNKTRMPGHTVLYGDVIWEQRSTGVRSPHFPHLLKGVIIEILDAALLLRNMPDMHNCSLNFCYRYLFLKAYLQVTDSWLNCSGLQTGSFWSKKKKIFF